ncbi:MAG: Uma2 family endonuclease [Chthoniobacterales bacterium]|nr:Uma2 family endonuclease [Chthoniobacterales bacterium]
MPALISASERQRFWTADEFLAWLKPGTHADLLNGEIFMHSPVNLKHARLLNFVERLLAAFIEPRHLGELHREVVAVRLTSRDVFLPDLCFFTTDQISRFQPTYIPVAPVFVFEAMSPRSAAVDAGPKLAAYEVHGVREYWILDPERLAHRFFRREGELLVEFAADQEIIRSQTIAGFWVRRSWLNPEQLPAVGPALAEIGLA